MAKVSFKNVLDGYRGFQDKTADKIRKNIKVASLKKKVALIPEPVVAEQVKMKIQVSSSNQRSRIFGKIKKVKRISPLDQYMEEVSSDSSVETVYFEDIFGGCNVTEVLFTGEERTFFLSDKKS